MPKKSRNSITSPSPVPPRRRSSELALDYLAREVENEKGQKTPADKGKSYEDIVWAIFNTKEFLFNL